LKFSTRLCQDHGFFQIEDQDYFLSLKRLKTKTGLKTTSWGPYA